MFSSSWDPNMNQMRRQMNQMMNDPFFSSNEFQWGGPFHASPFYQQHWHPWYSFPNMPLIDVDDLFNPFSQSLVDARQRQFLNSIQAPQSQLDETKAPDQRQPQGQQQQQQGQIQQQQQGGQLLAKDQSQQLSLPRAIRQGILVDVVEKDNFFELTADMPGLNKNDLKLSVDNNLLTISAVRSFEREIGPSTAAGPSGGGGAKVGEKVGEKGATGEGRPTQWRRFERMYGHAERSLRLPANVDSTKINAQYRDGVLTLILPKTQHPPKQPLQDIQVH